MKIYQYIDLDYIYEMADGDWNFLTEMIHDYIEKIPVYISDLRTAASAKNKDEIKFAAHKLSSSFLMMGARSLNEIAVKIEHGIKNDLSVDELPHHLESIDSLFSKVIDELQEELIHLKTSN